MKFKKEHYKSIESRFNTLYIQYDNLGTEIQELKDLLSRLDRSSCLEKEQVDSLVDWTEAAHKRLIGLEQFQTDVEDGSNPKVNGLSGRIDKLERMLSSLDDWCRSAQKRLGRLEADGNEEESQNLDNSEISAPQPNYPLSKNGIKLRPGTPVLVSGYTPMYIIGGQCDGKGIIPVKTFIRHERIDDKGVRTIEDSVMTMHVKIQDIEAIEDIESWHYAD